jgi:predicted nucleotidyltransferase
MDAIMASIVRRLVEACQPEAVYRFGSRARDQADADSDYELLPR